MNNSRIESYNEKMYRERIARLEAENGILRAHLEEYKKETVLVRNSLVVEREEYRTQIATLRAQLLESGRITDEARKQRDEALAKLEQANSEVKLALDVLTIYANPEQIFDTASAIIASRSQQAPATPEEKP